MTTLSDTSLLSIKNISKQFGKTDALTDFSLNLSPGTFCCLLGPSGCGKSTALRLIAGLESPDSGSISIRGRSMLNIPPQKRSVGMVFQNYALFPHMNVAENIAFGIDHKSSYQQQQTVGKMLEMVRLNGYENRSIDELSGGEQQRVALARSLARNPELLLLDEPFSNLDVQLKSSMQEDLFKLIQQVNITTILVTHDQEEAMSLADTIVLMNRGKIEQTGSPQELYYKPVSQFSAQFLGRINLFSPDTFKTLFASMELQEQEEKYDIIAIRPESFRSAESKPEGIDLQIIRTTFHGSFVRYTAKPANHHHPDVTITMEMEPGSNMFHPGQKQRFTFDSRSVCLLNK